MGTRSLDRRVGLDDNSGRLTLGPSHNCGCECGSMGRPHEVIPVRPPPHDVKENQLNDDNRNPKETLLAHNPSPLGGGKNDSL
jgi:hypothetical protein